MLRPLNIITRLSCLVSVLILVLGSQRSISQICSDPVNTIYGLTNSGFIHPINVNTGVVGSALNPAYTGNPPNLSNGLSYNPVNNKFYYFKRLSGSSPTEFVSFDPATNEITLLSVPSTTYPIYSGSITADGTGYYCWDTQGRIFYYNISSDTWTLITSSIVDQFGKDVDSIIRLHSSGDGAIDGNGNLLILPSSNTSYGLFSLQAPLPTTAVPSVTVAEVVSMRPPPSSFVGISLNSTGQIFMIASNEELYRLEDDLSITLMSTITLSMADLTSCNFPFAVLAPAKINFDLAAYGNDVKLSWTAFTSAPGTKYFVEFSSDNNTWKTISSSNALQFAGSKISYQHRNASEKSGYYRIRFTTADNTTGFSTVRHLNIQEDLKYEVWPNPVRNDLYINTTYEATAVFLTETGIVLRTSVIKKGKNSFDVHELPKGKYIITIRPAAEKTISFRIVKK